MARSEQSRCFHALFGLGQLIGVRADVRQAHGRGGKIALDSQRGLGHDGLVAVAVERVDERGELVGEALRLMDVAVVERLDQLAHRLWSNGQYFATSLPKINAGVIAYVEGIRGFIPASKLSLNYVEDLNE